MYVDTNDPVWIEATKKVKEMHSNFVGWGFDGNSLVAHIGSYRHKPQLPGSPMYEIMDKLESHLKGSS